MDIKLFINSREGPLVWHNIRNLTRYQNGQISFMDKTDCYVLVNGTFVIENTYSNTDPFPEEK